MDPVMLLIKKASNDDLLHILHEVLSFDGDFSIGVGSVTCDVYANIILEELKARGVNPLTTKYKVPKTMYVYFVSYSHVRGFGSSVIDMDFKILSWDDMEFVKKTIYDYNHIEQIIILGINLLTEKLV